MSAGFLLRDSAVSRKSWLTVSATECAPSASIAEEPVSAPATSFATAIARFAPPASRTVPTDPSFSPPAQPWDVLCPRTHPGKPVRRGRLDR